MWVFLWTECEECDYVETFVFQIFPKVCDISYTCGMLFTAKLVGECVCEWSQGVTTLS